MFKEAYLLLPKKYRKKLVSIVIIILGRTMLELVGLAVILPVFYLFVKPEAVNSEYFHKYFNVLLNFAGTTTNALALAALGAVIVLIIKSCLIIYLTKTQNRFLLELYKHFSTKLLNIYYRRGYLATKEFPASDFAYKINAVCLVFVNMILNPLFALIADIMILIFILTLSFILSPVIFVTIVLCSLPTVILYVTVIRKRLIKYGRLENETRRDQFRTITDTFRGYPEMIINGVFPIMRNRFENGLNIISDTQIKYGVIRQIPGYLIEISVVVCAGILTLVQMSSFIDVPQAIALFGVAILKVLPAIKGIISSVTSIKNCTYSIETIKEAIDDPQPAEIYCTNKLSPDDYLPDNVKFNSLKLNSISFGFASRQIFDNFTLTLNRGEKLGIRGESGIGKSTLFNIMLGLYPISSGSILLNDKPLSANIGQWHSMCGYVPQDVFVMNMSIAENIALDHNFNVKRKQNITLKDVLQNTDDQNIVFDIPKDIEDRIYRVLELAQLKEFVNSLPFGIFTVVGDGGCKLSGGQKQRLGIARALYKDPQILFFDEATSALNNEIEIEITNAIKNITLQNKSITTVIIAHRESSLEICDRIIEL